jgi:hypothetical protein
MNTKFLNDFVKQELYLDFGMHCVRVWQILLLWRNEKRDFIAQQYEEVFSAWNPAPVEPAIHIPYITKLKLPSLTAK